MDSRQQKASGATPGSGAAQKGKTAGKSGMEAGADNHAGRYTKTADDSSLSPKEREAAMLFSVAEGHLDDDEEDYDQALSTAEEALAVFRQLGDARGAAETARLAVHALRFKGDLRRYQEGLGDQDAVVNALEAAEKRAAKELAGFREAGNELGVAGMLLSQAEIHIERKTRKACGAGLAPAKEALAIYQREGDRKMEAATQCTLAQAFFRIGTPAGNLEAAKAAVEIYQDIGDRKGEAKALHACAGARLLDEAFDDAVRYTKESLAIFRELGSMKMVALEQSNLADWLLKEDRPNDALPFAKECLQHLQSLNYGKGYQAGAIATLAQIHFQLGDPQEAEAACRQGLQKLQAAGDRRQVITVRMVLGKLLIGLRDMDGAIAETEAGIAECKAIKEKSGILIQLLKLRAELFLKQKPEKDTKSAWKAMEDAIKLARDQKETYQEAIALLTLGDYRVQEQEFKEAEKAVKEARILFQKDEEFYMEACTLLTAAIAQAGLEDFDRAVSTSMEAHRLYGIAGDFKGQANALATLTNIHLTNKDIREAMRATKKRVAVCRSSGDRHTHAKALLQQAMLHMQRKEGRYATQACMEAVELCREHGDRKGEVEALCQLTNYHLVISCNETVALREADPDRKKPAKLPGIDKCFKYARDSLELARKIPAKDMIPLCLYWTAMIQSITEDFTQSIKTCNEAMDGFRDICDRSSEGHCVLLIAQSQRFEGKTAEAEETANRGLEMFLEEGNLHGVELAEKAIRGIKGQPAQSKQDDGDSGAAAAPKGPDPIVVRGRIKETVRQLLGNDDDFEDDNPLMEGGLDSLSAVQFRNDLVKEFGVNLPASMTFDYPTIQALVAHVVEISSA